MYLYLYPGTRRSFLKSDSIMIHNQRFLSDVFNNHPFNRQLDGRLSLSAHLNHCPLASFSTISPAQQDQQNPSPACHSYPIASNPSRRPLDSPATAEALSIMITKVSCPSTSHFPFLHPLGPTSAIPSTPSYAIARGLVVGKSPRTWAWRPCTCLLARPLPMILACLSIFGLPASSPDPLSLLLFFQLCGLFYD